ncbi:ATP-dependent RNA helicase DHX33 [Diabrotica virgifera virgifera]|uniref:RNA helicase n=1 Tax=Diabrotica virgifera virgifera TaxID=50390 RepID=A0A6P7F6K4_DIAVI|nr:ATP-dependent RNA helicase DHX33 [Diabrotica virgifera virgifera]
MMDSKYNNGYAKNGIQKFQMKLKPIPVVFNNKNGPPSPKKMKFNNENHNPSSSNGHLNGKVKISIQDQRRSLPVFDKRKQLLALIEKHKTLIILGETGSGKTTQIPQYIFSVGLNEGGKIAITQPRRVAAISVATRVAEEYGRGKTVGDIVGYSVRFQDCTSNQTKIKFLTDGMLLREAISDRLLMEYRVVILDEAHERTIHTDVLFGIVKRAQKIREDRNLPALKILIMSATMDVDHFSQYFNKCQAVYLEGRTFPVNIHYTIKPHDDYQASCVATFFKIHQEAPPNHDVLIFLTGQEEIEACAHRIRTLSKDPDVKGPPVRVFTLYAAQTSSTQMNIFQTTPMNTRKVVISTNIAETSITIPGIRYVIDSGMVKSRTFHPSTGLELLKVQKISHEQAWQRAGRAGRDSEGHCYRIYTRSQFELMRKTTIPEIQRANLGTVALQLLALGIHANKFDFMDAPPKEAITAAFEQLKLLGAVEDVDSIQLTLLGKKMARFPLDPRFSKILFAAQQYSCLQEALTIVSLLSAESILINPVSKQTEAQNVRQKFCSSYGDLITLLNIYRDFDSVGQSNKRSWCRDHFINLRNITHAREIRAQLEDLCKKCDLGLSSSCGSDLDKLRKCLTAGLFMNAAELVRDHQYVTLDKKQTVQFHPSSTLHRQQPHVVLFTEVVQTNKCYLRGLTTIDAAWLHEIAPEYMKNHTLRFNSS